MIKAINISNFLSHKKTSIEFSPGVNVIVGGTDSGKSAIIHAMRWAIFNRPNGDSFRSNWGGDTSVEIVTEDFVLTRDKTDKENVYSLGGIKDQKFLELKAFKTTVPEEVQKAINMNEVNIKSQDDPYFLLNKSPGEVTQHFNQVAHLNKIDLGRTNTDKEIRILKASIKADKLSLSGYRTDLKQYVELDIVESLIVNLERLERQQRKKVTQVQYMTQIVLDVRSVSTKIDKEFKLLSAEPLLNKILACSKEITDIGNKNKSLRELHSQIIANQEEAQQLDSFTKAEDLVISLVNINEGLDLDNKFLQQLQVLVNYIDSIVNEEKKLKKKLQEYEKEFHKNIGEVCPLCGEKITR